MSMSFIFYLSNLNCKNNQNNIPPPINMYFVGPLELGICSQEQMLLIKCIEPWKAFLEQSLEMFVLEVFNL